MFQIQIDRFGDAQTPADRCEVSPGSALRAASWAAGIDVKLVKHPSVAQFVANSNLSGCGFEVLDNVVQAD